jgi:hypothetical protein
VSRSFLFYSSVSLAALGLIASLYSHAEPVAKAIQTELKHHASCQGIQFQSIDMDELTQQERIELKEKVLKASLNNQAECLDETMQEQQSRLSQAAQQGANTQVETTGSVSTDIATSEQTNPRSSTNNENKPMSHKSQSHTSQSKSHPTGKPVGGSSAVCEAIKQGMTTAATETEKRHFEGLAKEYGCK